MGAQQGKTYTTGFHVLNVQTNSPGEEAGLISFFDYIVSANGIDLDRDGLFGEILKENVEKPVELYVYSSRDEAVRVTSVTPREGWGGKGLLGLSIRFCQLKGAGEFVWHILDVYPQSPASTAGLNAHTDYIVGTTDLVFSSSDDFFNLVSTKMGEVLKLYVYSSLTEEIRLVSIVPNKNWGGDGSLGCDVGYGLLHKIPTATGKVKPKESTGPKTTPSVEDLSPSELDATPLITPNAPSVLTSATPPSSPLPQTSSPVQLGSPMIPVTTVTPISTPTPIITPTIAPTVTPVAPRVVHIDTPSTISTINPPLPAITALPPIITAPPSTLGSGSISLPSTEQLQKQLEQLKLQQQKLQELRNKQLGSANSLPTSTSSPLLAPTSIPPSISDSSLAGPQFSAQALAQLKLQAFEAKQQQQQ